MYGSLQSRMEQAGKYEFKSPVSVEELLRAIGLPGSEVKVVMINSRPAHPESMIEPNDSVALFPREYPFFADWKDFCWNRKE